MWWSGNLEDMTWCVISCSSRKNCRIKGRGLSGSVVCVWRVRPGSKSGLSSRGVMGPGEGCSCMCLHAALKFNRVAPMRGCDWTSFGIFWGLIQGRWRIGIFTNTCSKCIQLLLWWCRCQSAILVRWHDQWYFWMSGTPKPPLDLGKVSLVQLSLGGLEDHISVLHILLYEEKKESGIVMGIAWNR